LNVAQIPCGDSPHRGGKNHRKRPKKICFFPANSIEAIVRLKIMPPALPGQTTPAGDNVCCSEAQADLAHLIEGLWVAQGLSGLSPKSTRADGRLGETFVRSPVRE
jgi:hypothetical protein